MDYTYLMSYVHTYLFSSWMQSKINTPDGTTISNPHCEANLIMILCKSPWRNVRGRWIKIKNMDFCSKIILFGSVLFLRIALKSIPNNMFWWKSNLWHKCILQVNKVGMWIAYILETNNLLFAMNFSNNLQSPFLYAKKPLILYNSHHLTKQT